MAFLFWQIYPIGPENTFKASSFVEEQVWSQCSSWTGGEGKGPGPMMAPSSQEVTQVKYMSDFCVYLLYVGTSEVT